MTTEELKQLKRGDENEEIVSGDAYTHSSSVLLPPSAPKYDPCRLFKKGDMVKPRAGRDVYACEWEDAVFHKLTGVYELEADEKEGHVTIFDNETGTECYVSVFAVELDTPVEELEPYYAVYNQERDCWDLMFRDVLCASFYVGRYPCAEDKVCAEVSRLNAEYRKGQE